MMLLDAFPPDFALVDAYDSAADGLVGVMGCPRPKVPYRLYAASDALALDIVAARHMGVRDPRQSSILRAACHWFGDPVARVEVIGVDEPLAHWRGPYHNDLSAFLSILALPVYVWGSGRGTLFVPEMDEQAFPPLKRAGRLLRIGRACDAAAVGFEAPPMTRTVIIVGAGMGGLTAALRLSRRAYRVAVIEASDRLGGLAAGLNRAGLSFDAGPYLLLDRPGLEWAFRELGLDLAEQVPMRRVDDVYQVEADDGSVVRIHADLEETAAGIDRAWPGGGRRYREFVTRVAAIHERLRPLLTSPRHGPTALLREQGVARRAFPAPVIAFRSEERRATAGRG